MADLDLQKKLDNNMLVIKDMEETLTCQINMLKGFRQFAKKHYDESRVEETKFFLWEINKYLEKPIEDLEKVRDSLYDNVESLVIDYTRSIIDDIMEETTKCVIGRMTDKFILTAK